MQKISQTQAKLSVHALLLKSIPISLCLKWLAPSTYPVRQYLTIVVCWFADPSTPVKKTVVPTYLCPPVDVNLSPWKDFQMKAFCN